jgi:UDP-sugar transporter A1/2/3
LIAVLSTCVTAGFAGVYFEKMLKDGTSTSLWIRNMQMYLCGVVSTSIGLFAKDSDHLRTKGFFWGYSNEVWCVIGKLLLLNSSYLFSFSGFLSVGGIYISLVMKYLDNLHKSFASAISIILVVILSVLFFDGITLGIYFMLGSFIVCSAVLLYNSVNE